MELAGDLTTRAVAAALPGRPARVYPAVLSTEADALAWARAGAPAGAIVVAEYQVSPRGRAGLEWRPRAETSLAFSLVLRPQLPVAREGWVYVALSVAIAEVVGPDATCAWPDEIRARGARVAAVGAHVELAPPEVGWAVANVLVENAPPPRVPLLARVVEAIEARCSESTASVLAEYLRRCETLGRRVRARMIPLGPGGVVLEGRAVTVKTDGALVIETDERRRLAVRPQSLGLLDVV